MDQYGPTEISVGIYNLYLEGKDREGKSEIVTLHKTSSTDVKLIKHSHHTQKSKTETDKTEAYSKST